MKTVSPAQFSAVDIAQVLAILTLVTGAITGIESIRMIAAVLAVFAILLQWRRLHLLARGLSIAAAIAAVLIAIFRPDGLQALGTSLLQGVSFAVLMMVLGMLRQPVRASPFVRDAMRYLLSYSPKQRYVAVNIGSHFLSILFNVGIIAMVGDLVRGRHECLTSKDGNKRLMVIAAMRGAAFVSIWSPVGLGFAIVSSSIPSLNSVRFLALAACFTAAALSISLFWPPLPDNNLVIPPPNENVAPPSARPLVMTLVVCAGLLIATILFHQRAGVSFTIASITILPSMAIIWLGARSLADVSPFVAEFREAIKGLGDLRTESATFLSANIIGGACSILLGPLPLWAAIIAYPPLIVLIVCLWMIPLAAAAYLPNSITVVMVAQLLGSGLIGQEHPLSLALMLAVSWAVAISVSPISAMCLVTGNLCGVSSRKVAHHWNRGMALTQLVLATVFLIVIERLEG